MSTHLYRLFKVGQGYYRPDMQGYTIDPTEAGTYTLEEAMSHCAGCHGTVRKEPIPQPEEGSSILASNLEEALNDAISLEYEYGSSKSAYAAGLRANLAYLRAHGKLTIKPS